MLRLTMLLALLVCAAPARAQANEPAPVAPALRAQVLVSSNIVRIGDLVDNAGAAASIAVFRAPDLGETGHVSVSRVMEALRPHNVFAVDTRGLSEIAVTRASRVYGAKEIEALLARAVAEQLRGQNAEDIGVTFDRLPVTFYGDVSAASELRLVRCAYDARSGRFDATLELPANGNARKTVLRYSGTAVATVEATVATRMLARGEILRASDIVVERRPKTEANGESVADPRLIIGQATRGTIRAGQILRATDLRKPEWVLRNESVLIVYEIPGITLTLRGKALESGGEGDSVNVMNLQSKRTLQAVVTAPGKVTLSAPIVSIPRLANLAPSESVLAASTAHQE